jgi:hypothetical protein
MVTNQKGPTSSKALKLMQKGKTKRAKRVLNRSVGLGRNNNTASGAARALRKGKTKVAQRRLNRSVGLRGSGKAR